jgi:hypothetical protein
MMFGDLWVLGLFENLKSQSSQRNAAELAEKRRSARAPEN